MTSSGVESLEVLVADGERSFADEAVEALEVVNPSISAVAVTSSDAVIERVRDRSESPGVDGVVVGDRLESPLETIERLAAEQNLPVILLTDAPSDRETIIAATEAGADDYFSRTTAQSRPDLLVERIACERPDRTGASDDRQGRGYEGIFDRVNDAITVHDPNREEIVDVNEAMADLLGMEREAILDGGVASISATPEGYTEERAYEIIGRVVDNDTAETHEWLLETTAGEHRWVEANVAPVMIHGERRALVISREVTERKAYERRLEIERDRRSILFEDNLDPILVAEIDNGTPRVAEVNEEFEDVFGYDETDLAGLSVAEALVPESEREQYHDLRKRSVRGEPSETEVRRKTEDGVRDFLMRIIPFDVGEGPRQAYVWYTDITERKRREREFEQIFDMAGDGIVIHDPESGEVVNANQQVADLLGYDRESIIDRPLSEFQAADEGVSGEQAREMIRESARERGQEFEWPLETADGETVWVRARHEIGDIRGERRVVALLQDITERRRREREFEQIFHGVNDTIAVFDPETGNIVNVNETYYDVWGYDDLETIQELGIEGLSATDEGFTEERGRELIREVAETGTTRTVEWMGETKEGEHRWTEAKLTPVEIGGQERVLSIQRDITERWRTERRLRTIVDRIDESIYLSRVDETTGLSLDSADMSAGFEEIWGQSLDEIVRGYEDGIFGPIHPDDEGDCRALLEEIGDDIASGSVSDRYTIEFRIERPDGAVRWVQAEFYPTEWESGPLRLVLVNRDITDRKEQQQRIASFHEATRELTAADSREMACRQAVTAAETVLGFPFVSTHLYDEERGELVPIAATSRLEDRTADLPPFGPGESLPWQVFVEGESVTSSDPKPDLYGRGVSGPDIVLSLGRQGVMLVGAPEGAFETEDVELAQVLAATLEAALNHVAGERALAAREQELRLQQERARRLETLNAVIRDIEQATVDRSSRAGIEEAVCQRLADVEGQDLVWIAEPTIQEDELVVRTSTGDWGPYLDALHLDLEASAGTHPAVSAYRHGETRVVENVATDVSGGPWRKTALRHAVQSVIAVPVSYEGSVHGILTVASAEPGAFDESTRDVLAELGRSVGHAITVVERERALESEGTVELELRVEDDGLFIVRATAVTDCQIRLERSIRRSVGDFSTFYVVDDASLDEVVDIADATPSVESASVVSNDDEGDAGLIEVTGPTWFGSVFTDHGAVLREATARNGEATVVVEAPQGTDVRGILERFRDQYPDAELVAQRHRERTIRSLFELQDILQEELTQRQWEALQTAYSAGYFAWPREASGEEVADLLDVTQPTFNKHLRVAEQKAVQLLIERDYPESGGRG